MPGWTVEHAVDALWILNDPAHYATLVLERGRPEAEHRRWLAGQMCAALLDARPSVHSLICRLIHCSARSGSPEPTRKVCGRFTGSRTKSPGPASKA